VFRKSVMTTQLESTIPDKLDGKRLDQALAVLFPDYSRSRLKEWILAGQVLLEGRQVAPRLRVRAGQQVVLTPLEDVRETARPEPIALQVVFEDDDLLLIDKPAGLVVHPGAGNPDGTLMNGLLNHAPSLANLPRGGILHRLDKDTTGLMLVAKSQAAYTRLVQDLQAREIMREYRGVCAGRLTAGGRIDAPIGRHRTQRTRMAVLDKGLGKGRESVTNYRVLVRFPVHTFCAMRLETGRTHQIRVHFAYERHALIGDQTYGGRLQVPGGASEQLATALRGFRRQALHACRIGFRHPVSGDDLQFQSPLPQDFIGLLTALGAAAEDCKIKDPKAWDEMAWPT
jgi:23S rRNA pseudouridine1911/1915/1917 synthase